MTGKILAAVLTTLALVHGAGAADSAARASEDHVLAAIRQGILARFPQSKVQSVSAVEGLPGLYEVVTPDEIVYTNASASMLFVGKVIDAASKADLTSKRWSEVHSIDFSTLPLNLAVKTVRGDGSRVLTIFADPLCPFCQEIEPELAKIDNITIYTFLFPLESLHPGATQQATRIWCAPDRTVAWAQWMLHRRNVSQSVSCDAEPLKQIANLGDKLKINSTPTLFFSDGRRVTGYLAASELEKELADSSSARPAQAHNPIR